MGKIHGGPDGAKTPWAKDMQGVWHFRPADDWWKTQADIQAHGRCGAAFSSVHVSTFWPGHLPDVDSSICETCNDLWRQEELPRLAQSILDGLGPLYVEAMLAEAPDEVKTALAWMQEQAERTRP